MSESDSPVDMAALVALARERRIVEAKRLREVWRAAVFGSEPMRPWERLSEATQARWMAMADAFLSERARADQAHEALAELRRLIDEDQARRDMLASVPA